MTGLEPATTRPPDVYANQLRYIPFFQKRCKVNDFYL
ncbi:unknown [Prevotella sp. CAG:487]|nr:unknown [Prevotella sp. CAG:487]